MFLRFKKQCECQGLSTPARLFDDGSYLTGKEFALSGSSIRPPTCLRCHKNWSVISEYLGPDRTHEECCDCTLEKVEPPECLGHAAGETGCLLFVSKSLNKDSSKAIYGYCPICGAKGKFRERRADGNDLCENGHQYPSKDALKQPILKSESSQESRKTIGTQHPTNEVYTQNGLLYRDKIVIDLPEADLVAKDHGFEYAEQLVRHLEKLGRNHPPKYIT